MATFTGTLTYGISGLSGSLLLPVQIASGGVVAIAESIPANQTALAITCAIAHSNMKMFYMYSDVAMTAQFFNGATGHESFSLLANQPVVWSSLSQLTSPITAADTTTVKVTNTTAGNFYLQCLQDVTP